MSTILSVGMMLLAQAAPGDSAVSAASEPVVADAVAAEGVAAEGSADLPAGAVPATRFDIMAFDVTGNSLLTADAIERAIYPYMGPDKTPDDVEKARAALEKAYVAAGYQSVFVQVPDQGVDNGLLQLQVTEARVAEVRVTGAKLSSQKGIRGRVPSLVEGQVPNLKNTERELTEANRFGTREITPLIEPGAEPGTINVELNVEEKLPLHGTLQLSNDYSQGTRPLRMLASARYTDLWGIGHQVNATYLVAPQNRDNLEVISASYLAPLAGSDWTMLLYGYTSNSNVASLGGTKVLGDGYAIGVRGILNLPSKSRGFFHSVNFGVDYKNFDESIVLKGLEQTIDTPIDYVALAGAYTMGIQNDKNELNATLGITAGVRGFGRDTIMVDGVSYPIFSVKRGSLEAKPNFVHVNLDADYTRQLGSDMNAFVRLSAQLADSPLISNEQFAAGGLSSARGYYQSEAVGDYGINGTVELRSPSIAKYIGGPVDEWRLFGFSDAAYVGIKDPLPGVADKLTLWSAGVGTRFQFLKYLSGEAVVAWPIEDSARGKGPFVTFNVKAEY